MATQGRGEALYRKLLAEGKARGWRLREIARRSRIPYWTLAGWRRRLEAQDREQARADSRPAVVPVRVAPARDALRDDVHERAVLCLRASGHRLLLPATLSVDELVRVVRALEGPGC